MANRFVYVALDYDDQTRNLAFAASLANVRSDRFGFKVNLDAVANFSPTAQNPYSFVKQVMDLGRPVFVDMKMWNGGRTMENIAKGCASLGVDIVNMYAHAGPAFIGRVKDSLRGTQTQLFAVTVLTHYTDSDTQRLYGCSLAEAAKRLGKIGFESGADGLIMPANHIGDMKLAPIKILSPGIRPAWYENKSDNDQEQTVTPREAIDNGANSLVVGSPVRKSPDPVAALERIIAEIS